MLKEDVHFLIDNAPPKEVEYVLRSLSVDTPSSVESLRAQLFAEWHFKAQKDLAYTPRRLFDLGLASKCKTATGKPGYILTELGQKVRSILTADTDLYADIQHYLHYNRYDGTPSSRKLFWSYWCCCQICWIRKHIPLVTELVAELQSRIADSFPAAYSQKVGGNFNAGGVTSGWKPWVMLLKPPPFNDSAELVPRQTRRFELVLLALDHAYRSHGYRYGDPVILDVGLVDEIARVFFLSHECSRELLALAAKMTTSLKIVDTFAGVSVNLLRQYQVQDI
jgi:hypothetical protein